MKDKSSQDTEIDKGTDTATIDVALKKNLCDSFVILLEIIIRSLGNVDIKNLKIKFSLEPDDYYRIKNLYELPPQQSVEKVVFRLSKLDEEVKKNTQNIAEFLNENLKNFPLKLKSSKRKANEIHKIQKDTACVSFREQINDFIMWIQVIKRIRSKSALVEELQKYAFLNLPDNYITHMLYNLHSSITLKNLLSMYVLNDRMLMEYLALENNRAEQLIFERIQSTKDEASEEYYLPQQKSPTSKKQKRLDKQEIVPEETIVEAEVILPLSLAANQRKNNVDIQSLAFPNTVNPQQAPFYKRNTTVNTFFGTANISTPQQSHQNTSTTTTSTKNNSTFQRVDWRSYLFGKN